MTAPAPQPLTRQDIEDFARRVSATFGGDQCAWEAMRDLRELADCYGLPNTATDR